MPTINDLLRHNPGLVSGGGAVTTDGATTDGDEAMRFTGTQLITVADSVSSSLAVGDGVSGGATLECWVRFSAFPASQKHIVWKSGAYALDVTADGHVVWTVTNGANTVTVTSASTLSLNTWTQLTGVYNGGYLGTTQFGKTSVGATGTSLFGDYSAGALTTASNMTVGRFPAPERGLVTSLVADLSIEQSNPYGQDCAAVMYADEGGMPGAKMAQSPGQYLVSTTFGGPIPLNKPSLAPNNRIWWTFPLEATVYRGLYYWLGLVGGALHTSGTTVLLVGCDATGGTRYLKNAAVSSSSAGPADQGVDDPFGAPASTDAKSLAVYVNYTATGRTGAEQKALLYMDGLLDASGSYGHGVADTPAATLFADTLALDLDDVAIYAYALTPAQIAVHYASR